MSKNSGKKLDLKIAWVNRIMKEIGIYPQCKKSFDVNFAAQYLRNPNKVSTIGDVIRELAKMGIERETIAYLFEWVKTDYPFGNETISHCGWEKVYNLFKTIHMKTKPFSFSQGEFDSWKESILCQNDTSVILA